MFHLICKGNYLNKKIYTLHRQKFIANGKEVFNLIAEKKGAADNNEIVVIGAHYDTCANPGADDNASGIAGILELARLFEKEKIRRNIQFVAFVTVILYPKYIGFSEKKANFP